MINGDSSNPLAFLRREPEPPPTHHWVQRRMPAWMVEEGMSMIRRLNGGPNGKLWRMVSKVVRHDDRVYATFYGDGYALAHWNWNYLEAVDVREYVPIEAT